MRHNIPDLLGVAVELWVVASKYLLEDLCAELNGRFAEVLQYMPYGDESISAFVGITKHVYVTRPDEAASFREQLVKAFTEWVTSVEGNEQFVKMVKDAPAFAIDVLESYMRREKKRTDTPRKMERTYRQNKNLKRANGRMMNSDFYAHSACVFTGQR